MLAISHPFFRIGNIKICERSEKQVRSTYSKLNQKINE